MRAIVPGIIAVLVLLVGFVIDSQQVDESAVERDQVVTTGDEPGDAIAGVADIEQGLRSPTTIPSAEASTTTSSTTIPLVPVPSGPSEWVVSLVNELPTEDLVAQLFVVELTTENALESLEEHEWGGVFLKLEESEPADAAQFIDEIQELSLATGIGLIVSSDVEGGRIIKMPIGELDLPGLLESSDDNLRSVNRRVAGELCGLGLNLNLAPVADVDVLNNPVLSGGRSFSDDPNEVARYVDLFIEAYGQSESPIATTTKHFPGHGATAIDSHLGVAEVGVRSELEQFHLAPFQVAIDRYATLPGAIMIGHLTVDGQDEPATFSNEIVTGWLRNDLGYDGVVISDDLANMAAITDREPGERANDAVLAGLDILLWNSPDIAAAAHETVVAQIEGDPDGELATRVRESAIRVLTMKEALGLHDASANRCGS